MAESCCDALRAYRRQDEKTRSAAIFFRPGVSHVAIAAWCTASAVHNARTSEDGIRSPRAIRRAILRPSAKRADLAANRSTVGFGYAPVSSSDRKARG